MAPRSFGGEIHDGYIWGRGAIDMKHMAAMSAVVMRLLKRGAAEARLDRDVIFTAVADEETGCEKGSLFWSTTTPTKCVQNTRLVSSAAFSLLVRFAAFYPIQIAKKECAGCARRSRRARSRIGPNPTARVVVLSEAIAKLGKKRLPQHPVESVTKFIEGLAHELPQPQRSVLRKLTVPQVAGMILDF